MNIATTQEGPTATVRLTGRLDGEGALQLAETLDRLLRDGRRSVVLDMSAVTYLSSPGTMVLQQAHQDYASARGELHVISPSREAADALALADLLPKLLLTPFDRPTTVISSTCRPMSPAMTGESPRRWRPAGPTRCPLATRPRS